MTEPEAMEWLTEARLARWNHLRERADLEPITKGKAAGVIANASWNDFQDIKERIG